MIARWHGLTVSAWCHVLTVITRWHVLTNISFNLPIPPIKPFSLRQPTSVLTALTAAPHYLSIFWGGVSVVTTNPSRTSASAVISVLSTTNVTASSATASCATPVVLSLRFLPGIPPPRSFPMFFFHNLRKKPLFSKLVKVWYCLDFIVI